MSSKPNTNVAVRELDWTRPTNLDGLKAFTPLVVNQMNKFLPSFLAGQGERMVRCLFTCVQSTPKLLDCAPLTLFGGVIQAGQLGLELGGPLGQAYLIPYGKDATFVLGYKGVVALAFRSSLLSSLRPVRVRAGDTFEVVEGSEPKIVHIPKRNNTGKVTDYYVTSLMTNGGRDFETFTYEEAMEFRNRYSSSRSAPKYVQDKMPWYDTQEGLGWNGFDWMAAKTLMKRLGKRLPVSVDFQRAIALDDAADANVPQNLGAIVDTGEPPAKPTDLRSRLDKAKSNNSNSACDGEHPMPPCDAGDDCWHIRTLPKDENEDQGGPKGELFGGKGNARQDAGAMR